MNLPNGHLLQHGKYRIVQVIGQGGFGITYKGIWYTEVKGSLGTVKTEVPVCIKEFFFKDYCYRESGSFAVNAHSETGRNLFDKFKEKLIKEAKILSEVHHPHIVNVLEVFEENNTAYIAMEYISGCSLKHMLDKQGVIPERQVLLLVRQIGEALQFVHEKNILHLDIKPSNILVDQAGKSRLIDFGVSKRYDMEQQETSTTMLTLSKGFASIEQYDSEGIQNFTPCPDIYSLGATMYNLLTGKIPVESILRATRPLPNPSEFNQAITSKTEAVILKAMQIIPDYRFQTIQEMMDALDLPAAEEVMKCGGWSIQTVAPDSEEEETTILRESPLAEESLEDEERTILNREVEIPSLPSQKKKGKRAGLFLLIAIFVSMISALVVWMQRNKQPIQPTEKSVAKVLDEPTDSLPSSEEVKLVEKPISHPQPKVSAKEEESLPQSDSKPAVIEEKESETKEVTPTVEEQDSAYAILIRSGKEAMSGQAFEEARSHFTKAKEVKLTEEVLRLLISCDEMEAKKQLADRKAQYELKKTFGKYTIVRKKSTMLYGAIDAEAHEQIPCQYRNVGIAENGRAFERKDGLYDIYSTDGVLINEGSTYY